MNKYGPSQWKQRSRNSYIQEEIQTLYFINRKWDRREITRKWAGMRLKHRPKADLHTQPGSRHALDLDKSKQLHLKQIISKYYSGIDEFGDKTATSFVTA